MKDIHFVGIFRNFVDISQIHCKNSKGLNSKCSGEFHPQIKIIEF